MGVLATNNRQLIYIYSEDSRLGKEVLSYVQGIDKALRIININKESISDTIWIEIADLLDMQLGDLFTSNQKSSHASAKPNVEYSTADWLKRIQYNPSLLQKPIAINATKAKQIEQSLDVYSFYGATGSDFDKSTDAIKKANHFNSVNTNMVHRDNF